jgi:hypothetical protein
MTKKLDDARKMSGEYKSAVGPIPDEWFENDTDPDAGKKMEPDGFTARLIKKLKRAARLWRKRLAR